MPPRDASDIQVLLRATEVLKVLGEEPGGLALRDVAERTGLAKTTARRILVSLSKGGLCDWTGDRYRLGLLLFELGMTARGNPDLREHSTPAMESLARATQETVNLFVRYKDRAVCLEQVEGNEAASLRLLPAGASLPLHIGAAGPVLLAHAPPAEIEEYIEQHSPLEAFTKRSLSDPDELRRELAACREAGWLIAEGTVSDDVSAIAAPVRDYSDRVVAAISLSAFVGRLQGDRLTAALQGLSEAAETISRALGRPRASEERVAAPRVATG